jgi:hypothetical protein
MILLPCDNQEQGNRNFIAVRVFKNLDNRQNNGREIRTSGYNDETGVERGRFGIPARS